MAIVTFILSGTTGWTVPIDWNNSNNIIECVGGGGGGKIGDGINGGGGGGGGAYSAIVNQTYSAGFAVTVAVGAGGANPGGLGGDTSIFNTSNTVIVCLAKGGVGGTTTGGAGGAAGSGTGTTRTSGGTGGNYGGGSGGGGGGSGGGTGNGNNGNLGTGGSGGAGGSGDAGAGGAGGAINGGTGGAGTEWDASHGSGGGGGGGLIAGGAGGAGGLYGGGGGGGAITGGGTGGRAGLLVITYTPQDFSGFLTDVDNEAIPVRRDPKRFHAASAQGLISPVIVPANATFGVSWFMAWSEPARSKRDSRSFPALSRFGQYYYFTLQPINTYESWYQGLAEPVRQRRGFQAYLQRSTPDIVLRRIPSNIMAALAVTETKDVFAGVLSEFSNLDYAKVSIVEFAPIYARTTVIEN